MTTDMKFNSLQGGRGNNPRKVAKADLPINLAVRLDKIELGKDGAPSYFHGFAVGSNEAVAVRMMTVAEGVQVNARQGEEGEDTKKRVHKMYVGDGEAHRPKPVEVNNPAHKTHCAPGGLLLFTKCLRNEDGTYRAHWAETLERESGAGCDVVTAHLRIREKPGANGKPGQKQVFADILSPEAATILTQDNVVTTLTSALAPTAHDVEKRRPFAAFRLVGAADGKVHVIGRVDPKYVEGKIDDPDTGESFKTFTAAPAEESVKNIFNPENDNRDLRVIRAALHGLGAAEGYPEFKDVSDEVKKDLQDVTDHVRSGALKVEVIPGERISAGPATRASMIKSAENNKYHPLNNYSRKDADGNFQFPLYAKTFLVTMVGKDGARFFSKAVPVDLYPQTKSLKSLATANDFKAAAAEAQSRVAVDVAPERELHEDARPVEPAEMDTLPGESMEAQLAQSEAALAGGDMVYD